jgi:SAM-dependent methyltransferase
MTETVEKIACPACESTALQAFHEQKSIPVSNSLLVRTEEEALAFPRGDLKLKVCTDCGFVFNALFSTGLSEYSENYEETQGFSPRFQAFMKDLAQKWIDRYDIHGKDVLEIGCGKGEFLATICELGNNKGVGVDPSAIPGRLETTADVTLIPEFYGPAHASIPADVIVCRHTLEHIAPVAEFMRNVRDVIGDRLETVVLFELPDVMRVLEEVGFWDVYYEHCSYFTTGSLARLFRRTGFEVLDVALDYDDQYILVEARPVVEGAFTGDPTPIEEEPAAVVAAAQQYRTGFEATLAQWRGDVEAASAAGKKPVIWGGGSKGVAYLTTLQLGDLISYAVDINPNKQGKFIAGSGQQVVAPDFLREYGSSYAVVMNPIYVDEIGKQLADLGIDAELHAV